MSVSSDTYKKKHTITLTDIPGVLGGGGGALAALFGMAPVAGLDAEGGPGTRPGGGTPFVK